jgi:hypothetical protein
MPLIVADRVKETTTTTGSGTLTLAGAATGFVSFSAVGNGNQTYYTIASNGGSEWEVGIGTYTSAGTTLSRDVILASSNAGSVVTLSAGTKDVFVTFPASRLQPRVVALADATSITPNINTSDIVSQTNTQAAGTLTIKAPTGSLNNGQRFIIRLQATNAQTFSWNAIYGGSTDLTLPTVSSSGAKYDYLGFIYNTTANKWQLLAKNFGF